MEKTIAAISTGPIPAGISIIRMSGPEAIQIADLVYHNKRGNKLSGVKSHTIHYGFITDGNSDIDEVLVSVMRAPHTFTGEDTVEINCHGGILVTKKILELLIRNGASVAEPGEFTKRAFLNGKMDLTRAEAVIDVIEAKNEYALQASVTQLRGAVQKKVQNIRDELLNQIAFIEAALDDPEHYDLSDYSQELSEGLSPIQDEIREMIRRSEYGMILKEGIRTVISGRPNAGKSSLLNLLSGYEKAIVTEIAGTTRDILETEIRVGSLSLILVDTAGIRDTLDTVEMIGVRRAESAMEQADLILYVIDSVSGVTEEDIQILTSIHQKKVIILLNKSDLSERTEELSEVLKQVECENKLRILPFSAKTGMGQNELEQMILSMYESSEISMNDQVTVTNLREKEELLKTEKALQLVQEGISNGMSEDFLTIDLMDAYAALGRIIGEEVQDDVVDRVFSRFCMGK